jgi:hypothetical protein
LKKCRYGEAAEGVKPGLECFDIRIARHVADKGFPKVSIPVMPGIPDGIDATNKTFFLDIREKS